MCGLLRRQTLRPQLNIQNHCRLQAPIQLFHVVNLTEAFYHLQLKYRNLATGKKIPNMTDSLQHRYELLWKEYNLQSKLGNVPVEIPKFGPATDPRRQFLSEVSTLNATGKTLGWTVHFVGPGCLPTIAATIIILRQCGPHH